MGECQPLGVRWSGVSFGQMVSIRKAMGQGEPQRPPSNATGVYHRVVLPIFARNGRL
jgi:hypothetical protein